MIRFILIFSIFLLSTFTVAGQEIKINISTDNLSNKLNDGTAKVEISGGKTPYIYMWSKKDILQDTDKATGLTEGKNYRLTVKDSNGKEANIKFKIEAKSADERINSFFIPIVDVIGTVVMFDIFAALHIYDPVIKNEKGEILYHANGEEKKMSIPFIVIWLVFGAAFFTIKMKFINIRGFKHAIDLVRGKYDAPGHKGEVSHFQALATALSATVGLGNIAGVAIAMTIGGPGATFWMIVAGLLGMSAKFTEVTLGVKYRRIDKDGQVSGGPMFYLQDALKKKKLGKLGRVLAILFAVLVIGGSFGGGNMFQANQAFSQVSSQFSDFIPGIEGYGAFFGIGLAIVVGFVVIGGIQGIAKVTEKIVPFMAILYVLVALIIIFMNIDKTGEAFTLIFEGAFAPSALKGGIVGVLIVGFQRAAFSNEAGVGSASIAHSAVKTNEPVSEGIVALLEPFIDTVVICTMTALVIIFSGYYAPEMSAGLAGAELTSKAFSTVFSWFPWLLTLAILLFAVSTMISWSYYGLNGFKFLLGDKIGTQKITKHLSVGALVYYIIFLGFVVVGASSSLGAVIDFSDMMILSMGFPNLIGLLIMGNEVKGDLKEYFKKVKDGTIKKYK